MKKFINKILNVPKLILTIWIILWVILILLLVLKFCFGIWYPIISDNKTFIDICNFIDENKWFYILISGLLYIPSLNIICLTCLGKKSFKSIKLTLYVNLFIILGFCLKVYNSIAGNIFEIFFIFLNMSIVNLKFKNFNCTWKNILVPIIEYAVLNLWQFTMLLVRGTDKLVLNELPMLVPLILQIDYYIFILISWIGVSFMGWFSAGWFWSKDVTVLKAEKEKELAKKNPDMDKVAKIENRILELEGK